MGASRWAGTALAAMLALIPEAQAEALKLAVGQRGNWDTSVAELGQRAGIFKRHDLELELLYTSGGGETQQAVLSRSVDIGMAAGLLGVLGAASKGAPVRVIGAEVTGAAELYWYVPAASPVRSVQDLAGRTVGFSTTGSSTNSVALQEQAQSGVAFKLVATGGLPATYTQVMSGQVDAGWASAPFGVEALDAGKIRTVFRGTDVTAAAGQTVRVTIAHAAVLASKKAAVTRFMQAYRETLEWMYTSPDAIPMFAEFSGISQDVARRTRDEYFPRAALDPDHILRLDAVMADGVGFKFLQAPLTPAQVRTLIQLQVPAP